ncbi:hypothetical protein ABOM_003118 [Aspergillus bombycis]|uniref:Uncharacterized protein n=1 Tax=Aspergillus bombycis TaxID=109264 RepID=A0A1F8AC71_9EURO|nr:hypothetical protein ABOM_003118 [Aspergillus bombycis]OGM48928.1 hypothetical protein ABOM_003118 [Aspergillus bombycis]
MFRYSGPVREGWVVPERPENFDTLSKEKRRMIDKNLESETIYKYYKAQVYKRAPSHWSVLHDLLIPILRKPVWLDQLPCPIEFTDEEHELYSKEEDNIDGVGRMLALFRDQGVLPVDGMVDPEDYETAMENSRRFKDIFIGLAKDEAERELYKRLWPYQM